MCKNTFWTYSWSAIYGSWSKSRKQWTNSGSNWNSFWICRWYWSTRWFFRKWTYSSSSWSYWYFKRKIWRFADNRWNYRAIYINRTFAWNWKCRKIYENWSWWNRNSYGKLSWCKYGLHWINSETWCRCYLCKRTYSIPRINWPSSI